MLRSDRRLDPAIQDELDALDAALRGEQPVGGGADAPDGAGAGNAADGTTPLATLVADVRAARPALEAGARARLEERVAQSRAARRGTAAAGRSRRSRLVLALAAVVAVAVPVGAIALHEGSGDDAVMAQDASDERAPARTASGAVGESSGAGGEAHELRSAVRPAPSADGPDASGAAGSSAGSTSSGALPSNGSSGPRSSGSGAPALSAPRRVIRDVRQTVRVTPDGVARAAAQVSAVVEDAGGYLASSAVRERGANAGGTFDVVVPVGRLDETVAALGRIGRPVRLERTSSDVTERAASLQDRLDDERADRAAVRLQLARTVDPERRAARRRELRLLSSRIAGLEGQRDELGGRTSTARIALRLTTRDASAAAPPSRDDAGRWGIGDAWRDAGRVLEVAAGGVLLGAVVLLPVALLIAGVAVLRRRAAAAGRDRVIGGA